MISYSHVTPIINQSSTPRSCHSK